MKQEEVANEGQRAANRTLRDPQKQRLKFKEIQDMTKQMGEMRQHNVIHSVKHCTEIKGFQRQPWSAETRKSLTNLWKAALVEVLKAKTGMDLRFYMGVGESGQ